MLTYSLSIAPLANNATAPATTGEATEVPDKDRHPDLTLLPLT